MKTKNLIIGSVWLTVSIIFVVLMWLGAGYSDNPMQWLLWTEHDFLVVFIIALIFTGAVAFLLPEKGKTEPELITDLQTIRSNLDVLTGEVDKIKKMLEE